MRLLVIAALLFVQMSCMSQKTIKYKGLFAEGEYKMIEKAYFIDLPKGGELDDKETNTGDFHAEYRMIYPDSSIIYVTNDEMSGSILNAQNLINIGKSGYTKKHLMDTLDNGGEQENGLYWREYILGEIVVGYLNVPKEKKEQYDKALATLRRKK